MELKNIEVGLCLDTIEQVFIIPSFGWVNNGTSRKEIFITWFHKVLIIEIERK